MIEKVEPNKKIIRKMSDKDFKDTISAKDLNIIYDYLTDMEYDLEDILAMLQGLDNEEALYLAQKLGKMKKYISGIAFRPGCYDSEGDYYGENNHIDNYAGEMNFGYADCSDTGGYPGNCVVTSE